MAKSTVSIVRVGTSYKQAKIDTAVRKAVELAGGIAHLFSPGDLVLLKPNVLATAPFRNGAVTSPEVCRAMYDLVRELGGRPVIAESAAVGADTEKAYEAAGYYRLREEGYEVIDLKSRPTVTLPIPNGWVLQKVTSFDLVAEARLIISLAAMKTHDQCEVTLSLKNLKGLEADKDKKGMHKVGINRGISDINAVFRPGFALIDGITAQEGLGPLIGRPVPMGLLLAGNDLVALDAVTSEIMGFDPAEIQVTRFAAERGLGTMNRDEIEVVGENVDALKRRFMRAIEDCPVEIEGFSIIYGEDACTGCRNCLMSSLVDMKNGDQYEYLRGMTLVVGNADIPEEIADDHIVTIGNCVPKEKRRGRSVRGCPPNNVWIVQGIIGDRGTATQVYGTESGEEDDDK